MVFKKRRYLILSLIAVVALVGGIAAVIGTNQASAGGAPGQIDDGADLLPQASITLEQAITAAQTTGSGAVGEVDLETYQGRLVFNVDIGQLDVKVDAADGSILGQVSEE